MGLFGWHRCSAEGCAATLFIPLFEEKDPNSKWWQEYLAEKARWRTTGNRAGELCPVHKSPNIAPPAPP